MCPALGLQYGRDTNVMERVQRGITKMVWDWSTSPVRRISSVSVNTQTEDAKKMEPGSSQWCSVSVQETNCNTEAPSEHQEAVLHCRVMEHHHGLPKGCGFSSLEISRATWTWPAHPVLGVPARAGVGPHSPRGPANLNQPVVL